MTQGILIVTHVFDIANGLPKILKKTAPHLSITAAGGDEHNEIGVSLDKIVEAIERNEADEIIAFYDFGSAQIDLDMASKLTNKTLHISNLALVEGSYAAATLLEAGESINNLDAQLSDLAIHK